MERLQQAIEKARLDRNRNQTRAVPAVAPPSAPVVPPPSPLIDAAKVPAAAASDAAWNALPLHVVSARQLNRNRLIGARSDASSVRIDILRTRLLQQMRGNNWSRIMITSPTPGCGKSTLACNLAYSLLRQQDCRVLVLDFDLRRPSLGKLLDIPDNLRPGIGAVLAGAVPFADSAMRLGDQVAICAAKLGPESRPELLKSKATREMIEAIQRAYQIDLILFDVPPIFANDDAIAVAEMVDCGMIVAAAGQTSVDQIDRAERELAQYTQVVGVVANKLQFEENLDSADYY